ncbi:MAG: hypothetical protein M1820_002978 [Bogoriella megaspora]|nr:MAG: hypothetical protein M1820_002978 [Bogoriella megaspora]
MPAQSQKRILVTMAKGEKKNAATRKTVNPHLHARATHLYRAANYLAVLEKNELHEGRIGSLQPPNQQFPQDSQIKGFNNYNHKSYFDGFSTSSLEREQEPSLSGLSRHLVNQLLTTRRKSQIRLSREMKRSICKRCETVLIPGSSCRAFEENISKGGKKKWCDNLVIECLKCGAQKRFPVGLRRQLKKSERIDKGDKKDKSEQEVAEEGCG